MRKRNAIDIDDAITLFTRIHRDRTLRTAESLYSQYRDTPGKGQGNSFKR